MFLTKASDLISSPREVSIGIDRSPKFNSNCVRGCKCSTIKGPDNPLTEICSLSFLAKETVSKIVQLSDQLNLENTFSSCSCALNWRIDVLGILKMECYTTKIDIIRV